MNQLRNPESSALVYRLLCCCSCLILLCMGIGAASTNNLPSKTYHDSWGNHVYRGANVAGYSIWDGKARLAHPLTVEDFRVLRSWGADHIRLQITGELPIINKDTVPTFSEESWQKLDAVVAQAHQAGLKVILDLHQGNVFVPSMTDPEGWWKPEGLARWQSPLACQGLSALWGAIAKHYAKDRKTILGYDIFNEPRLPENQDGWNQWNALCTQVIKSIRAEDRYHTIILEAACSANQRRLDKMTPLLQVDPSLVFSIHIYDPWIFCGQGTDGKPATIAYPGMMPNSAVGVTKPVMVDKAWLIRDLQPAVDFQQKTGARIYVGEFNAIRFAPDNSAARWLEDALNVFDANGWSWDYHCFREWQGWDLEIGTTDKSDTKRLPTTDRLEIVKKYFHATIK